MVSRPEPVWPALLVYWLVQPIVLGIVLVLWLTLFPAENGRMDAGGATGETLRLLANPGYWFYVLLFALVISAAQAVYLWPARKPGITKGRGRSIRASVAIAGLVVGLGGLALTVGVVGAFDRALETVSDRIDALPTAKSMMLVALLFILVWVAPSLLIVRFCGTGRRETVLHRLACRLLMGTGAEAALLIPVDAMMRRKTDCYCSEGSFLGLSLLGLVGFVGAGPAVLLPLFATRRRGWYRVRCNACGYDMRGSMDAPRCPECGEGWAGRPETGASGLVPAGPSGRMSEGDPGGGDPGDDAPRPPAP